MLLSSFTRDLPQHLHPTPPTTLQDPGLMPAGLPDHSDTPPPAPRPGLPGDPQHVGPVHCAGTSRLLQDHEREPPPPPWTRPRLQGLQSVPTARALWDPSPGRPPVPTLLGRSGTKRTTRPGPTRHPHPCARRHPSPSSCADSTSSPASTCLRRRGARLHAGGGRWPGRRSLLASAASG